MQLPEATARILANMNRGTFEALEQVSILLRAASNEPSHKKDTEFDTVWALAVEEGKTQGVKELLQVISNPIKYVKKESSYIKR